MKRVALALLFGALVVAGCKKPSADPPPDPNAIHHCSIEDAKVVGRTLELGRIHMSGGFDEHALHLPGSRPSTCSTS